MGISRKVSDYPAHGEELLKAEKLESIGVLAGGIAHEFNNLLTSIIGNVTLVKGYLQDQNKKASFDALEMVIKASHDAQGLTQKLLTFAKGGAPLRSIIPANQLLRETVSSTLCMATVEHCLNIEDNLPTVKVDKEQIKQVIQNIVTNAYEAMSNSGVLGIRAESVVVNQNDGLPLAEGNYVKIKIEDSGAGIPMGQMLKVFDPFYTTKIKNSGLGLTTAYSVTRQHGGFITVDSQIGNGTAFSVYIPVCLDTTESIKTAQPKQKQKPELQTKHRILVLDDEQCITTIASKMLKKVGYIVQTANTGELAVTLFREAKKEECPFDLVILDLTVAGGIGGKEVIRIVREEDPNIKAIVSSGYFDDPVMANYQCYGFDQVVSKPYTFSALTCAVKMLLRDK